MSTSSFLFGGNPPPEINTTSSETAQLPTWYQEYLQGLMGTANTIAAQPFQQYSGPRLADFNSTQQNAFDQTAALPGVTSGALSSSQNALNNAAGQNISGAMQPYINASTSSANNPSAASQPYMNNASGLINQAQAESGPANLQNWMSPYTSSVVQGLTDSANQNWNNTIMPSVNDAFTAAGQYGSGRNSQIMGQAANQFQTNLEGQVSNALQSGYNTAGTLSQQQAGLTGSLANLNLGQASTAAGTAGQEAGILQGAGALAGQGAQQQGALNLGVSAGQDSLAGLQQQTALQNAAAQQAVGNQQQQQSQNNLNLAYSDFQNQNQWPASQAEFMSQIIRGLPSPGSTTSTSSNVPQSPFSSQSPSVASSLGSLLTGAGSSSAPSFTFAKGGLVPGIKYLAGGGPTSWGGALSSAPGLNVRRVGLPSGALHYAHLVGAPKTRGALSFRRA